MRILFLSPNLEDYQSAFYQRDFYHELANRHDVIPYGPGFETFDAGHSMSEVLETTGAEPAVICLGHNWLHNDPGKSLGRMPNLDLGATDIPVVLVLNKEYTRFEQKVDFAVENDISLVFTHHHRAADWTAQYEPEFVFWPFAVNTDHFRDYGESKRYDVTFSGILRNPDPQVPQTDVRKRIQDHMFHTLGNVWLRPKARFRNLDLFWSIRPTSLSGHVLYKLLGRDRHLPAEDYKRLLNQSKIGLNSLSPMDLVGTRYYETMASNTLALCQESSIYTKYDLFEPGTHVVTFADDLSDFDEKLFYYLEHDDERREIASRGHEHVLENHTWSDRVETFTETVRSRFC